MVYANAHSLTDAPEDLSLILQRYTHLVRREIERVVWGRQGLEGFYGMMAYHLGWVDQTFAPQPARAGKQLRPNLCLLLAEALGTTAGECAALAAGIELLHNFSLIHDDIEDRSRIRHGRPVVWSVWGEAQAINAGDGMFSLAHLAWHNAPLAEHEPTTFVAILRELEETIVTLCEGQFQDISGEGSLAMSSAGYIEMIGRKTAALLGASAWVAARSAGADPETTRAARTFGHELGVAFQIRDDLLGIWGDERETGKSASSDIATRKMTLPIILALETGSDEQRAALLSRYGTPPREKDDEARIRALLETTGADRQAIDAEEEHWQRAMHALNQLPIKPDWRALAEQFARAFVARRA